MTAAIVVLEVVLGSTVAAAATVVLLRCRGLQHVRQDRADQARLASEG